METLLLEISRSHSMGSANVIVSANLLTCERKKKHATLISGIALEVK
jgi:hypothetical protein